MVKGMGGAMDLVTNITTCDYYDAPNQRGGQSDAEIYLLREPTV